MKLTESSYLDGDHRMIFVVWVERGGVGRGWRGRGSERWAGDPVESPAHLPSLWR